MTYRPRTVWMMWGLGTVFYAYQYILRVLPNIMGTQVAEKFHMDSALFGQFSGLYYIGYAAAHIPLGVLLDRFGPRAVMTSCVLLTVLGGLPILYTDFWLYPSIGRALIGIGSSAAILGVFKIIRIGFGGKKFTRMVGFTVTIGLIGAMYGGRPVTYLMQTYGWEIVLKGLALVGILLAVSLFMAIPPLPESKRVSKGSVIDDIKVVFSQQRILLICILGGFMVGPLEGFADVWGTEYLKTAYGVEASYAETLPSMIFLGMCFGCPLLSYWAERSEAYTSLVALSAFVMGSAFLFLLQGVVPVTWMAPLFILVGGFCAYQILVIYKASTYVSERLVGLTTAYANMIIMTFGYVFHGSIGGIMKLLWNGNMLEGHPVYGAETFTYSLGLIPIGLILGFVGFVWLRLREGKRSVSRAL